MIPLPDTSEQRGFIRLFFKIGGGEAHAEIMKMVDKYNDAEVNEVAISIVPMLIEMSFSEACIEEVLAKERLPGFAAFKKLNSRYVSRILKKKKIINGDDILLIKDALENNLLSGADLQKGEALIENLDL